MVKKGILLLSIIAMLVSLVACGGGGDTAVTTTSGEEVVTTVGGQEADVTTTTETEADTTSSKVTGSGSSNQSTTRTTTTTTTTTKTTKAKEYRMMYYPKYQKFIQTRSGLKNTGYKIVKGEELTIAFMGGSVTDGMGSSSGTKGFRGRLLTDLQSTYDVECSQIEASLGGNGSQYGVYITDQFVAGKKPDLVFIEYAVNNAYDGVTDADTLWNHYESMIHMIRKANPYADIVLVYVSDEANRSKSIIPVLEEVAEKYDLPSVNLYEMINSLLKSSGESWSSFYSDSVHMNDGGYNRSAQALRGLIEYGIDQNSTALQEMSTPSPKTTIQSEAKIVLTSELTTVPSGWAKNAVFSYASTKYGGCIETTEAGKTITVKFKGTDFGVLVEFAEDAGVLEYSIDGGAYQQLNCKLDYSNPKARILLKGGTNGEHTITMRLGSGSRMAIAAFLLNGTVQSVR